VAVLCWDPGPNCGVRRDGVTCACAHQICRSGCEQGALRSHRAQHAYAYMCRCRPGIQDAGAPAHAACQSSASLLAALRGSGAALPKTIRAPPPVLCWCWGDNFACGPRVWRRRGRLSSVVRVVACCVSRVACCVMFKGTLLLLRACWRVCAGKENTPEGEGGVYFVLYVFVCIMIVFVFLGAGHP
jgi:hypothetical protein